jgi:hypothetical protein
MDKKKKRKRKTKIKTKSILKKETSGMFYYARHSSGLDESVR